MVYGYVQIKQKKRPSLEKSPLEWFSEPESARIRSAVKFCVGYLKNSPKQPKSDEFVDKTWNLWIRVSDSDSPVVARDASHC